MTDLHDRPLPRGAVYHRRMGRLELSARVQADSLIIEAKSDSLPPLERRIISESIARQLSTKAEAKVQEQRKHPPPILAWLGYIPYILMLIVGVWIYRLLYRR